MTRLQKFALYRSIYYILAYIILVFYLYTESGIVILFAFTFLHTIVQSFIKKRQKKFNPGLGPRLDELETLIELRTYKLVSQGIFWYVILGGLTLLVTTVYTKIETFSIFTFSCFVFGLLPVQELLHLIGVQYYTSNEKALKETEFLVR